MDWTWIIIGSILMVIGFILMFTCSVDKRQGKELNNRKFVWSVILLLVGAIIVGTYVFGGIGPPERQPYKEIKSVLFIPPHTGGIFIS